MSQDSRSPEEQIAAHAVRRFTVTLVDRETTHEQSTYVDLFLDDPETIRNSIVQAVNTMLTNLGILKPKGGQDGRGNAQGGPAGATAPAGRDG